MNKKKTAKVDTTDVDVTSLYDNFVELEDKVTVKGGVLYGEVEEFVEYGTDWEVFGWYRVTKTNEGFVFESFVGEPEDESAPLLTKTMALGTYVVEDDAVGYLLEAIFGEDVEPEFPSATTTVVRWIMGQRHTSSLHYHYRALIEQVEGLELTKAGGIMPFQAEGTIAGLPFYFRYRHDVMRLTVAATYDDIWRKPLYKAAKEYGDGSGYGGSLDTEEFIEHFMDMLTRLERSPILWEFEGTYTRDLGRMQKAGERATMRAWGFTAEEAWENLNYVDENYPENYSDYIAAHGLNPQSTTVDDRVFPDPEPDFSALVRKK